MSEPPSRLCCDAIDSSSRSSIAQWPTATTLRVPVIFIQPAQPPHGFWKRRNIGSYGRDGLAPHSTPCGIARARGQARADTTFRRRLNGAEWTTRMTIPHCQLCPQAKVGSPSLLPARRCVRSCAVSMQSPSSRVCTHWDANGRRCFPHFPESAPSSGGRPVGGSR